MNDGITAWLGVKISTLALNKIIIITCQCRDFSTELCMVLIGSILVPICFTSQGQEYELNDDMKHLSF